MRKLDPNLAGSDSASSGHDGSPSPATRDRYTLSIRNAFLQIRDLWMPLVVLLGMVIIAGVILVIIHFSDEQDVALVVKDPREFTGLPFRTGVYSNLGILLLWSVAIIMFVFGILARPLLSLGRYGSMLVVSALLHGFLALDDLLLIHEELGLVLSKMLGTDDVIEMRSKLEGVVFAVYGLLWGGWAWIYRAQIARTAWIFLLLGIGGFVASVVVDVGAYLFPQHIPWYPWMPTFLDLSDEMFKFAGYVMLAGWAWWVAKDVWRLSRMDARETGIATDGVRFVSGPGR